MVARLPSLHPLPSSSADFTFLNDATPTTRLDSLSHPTDDVFLLPKPMAPIDGPNSNVVAKMRKKKKPRAADFSEQPQQSASSSSSCCTSSFQAHRGIRVSSSRRNPKVLIGSARQKENDIEALALPLGMSIAAVVAQILEQKDVVGERMPVDHLSTVCALAVRESLANVFGDKFDCFVKNFEKSFRSTLMTLRLINESSQNNGSEHQKHLENESCSHLKRPMSLTRGRDCVCKSGGNDYQSEAVLQTISAQEQLRTLEETEENMTTDLMNQQLILHDEQSNLQLACVSSSTAPSSVNESMLSVLEKSVVEQARSNDLKTFELGLQMKKLRLKEQQLSLNSDLNILERLKLKMGISKASFKAEKFKNQLEETRHAELLKSCIDCLVAGMLIMLASLAYGTYVYSHRRITEATASCTPSKESSSWWIPKPVASFNSTLQILMCQVQVVSRMLFGVLMILAIAYLLLLRSAASNQTMPITFMLMLLGVFCGFAGTLCVNALGGSGYHWLFYWEALCMLHLFSNICTSALFIFLHGPITISEGAKSSTIFPYWIRRLLFYATVLLFLPLLCGFMPFANPSEWNGHFSALFMDLLLTDAGH